MHANIYAYNTIYVNLLSIHIDNLIFYYLSQKKLLLEIKLLRFINSRAN